MLCSKASDVKKLRSGGRAVLGSGEKQGGTGPAGAPVVDSPARMEPKAGLAWLLLAMVMLSFGLGERALIDPDEGRNAVIVQEMAASGDLLFPHLNGLPFLDKPFLYFALASLSVRGLGSSEFALRLPSLLFGWGTILLTAWFAARLFGRATAWVAGTATAAWVAMALGVFTKGPVALLLPLLVAVPYASWRRRLRAVMHPAGFALRAGHRNLEADHLRRHGRESAGLVLPTDSLSRYVSLDRGCDGFGSSLGARGANGRRAAQVDLPVAVARPSTDLLLPLAVEAPGLSVAGGAGRGAAHRLVLDGRLWAVERSASRRGGLAALRCPVLRLLGRSRSRPDLRRARGERRDRSSPFDGREPDRGTRRLASGGSSQAGSHGPFVASGLFPRAHGSVDECHRRRTLRANLGYGCARPSHARDGRGSGIQGRRAPGAPPAAARRCLELRPAQDALAPDGRSSRRVLVLPPSFLTAGEPAATRASSRSRDTEAE